MSHESVRKDASQSLGPSYSARSWTKSLGTHMTVLSSISLQLMRKPICSLFPHRCAPCMPCQRLGVPGRTVREALIRDHPATVLDQHRLPVHLPSSIESSTRLEIVSHPLQTCMEQLEIIASERKVSLSTRTSFTFESVTMSSTAKIIAATDMLKVRALPCLGAGSQNTELTRVTGQLMRLDRVAGQSLAWLALKIHASDRGDNAREVRSSRIVGGTSLVPRREDQHFLGGIGQENVQIIFSFSDMLFKKHWKQIPKKNCF